MWKVPGETYEQLVKRVNSGCTIGEIITPKAKASAPMVRRLMKELGTEDLQLLHDVLTRRREVVIIEGERYLRREVEDRVGYLALRPDATEHFILNDLCSCPDCHHRNRECKHLRHEKAIQTRSATTSSVE